MPTNKSRASYDTFIAESFPATNYGSMAQMHLAVGSGNAKYGYVYFAGVPKPGTTVFSATLSVWLRGSAWATGGPYTIKVSRITDQWYESKLTWNRSSGGADHSTTHQASSAAITGGADGQQVDIDVSGIMSDIAAGTAWYGFFVEVDTSPNPGYLSLYSSEATNTDYRPQLTVAWSVLPDAPTDLAPSGGQVTALSKPTLRWTYKDADGDDQASLQVQISTVSDFSSTTFDSGWISDNDHHLDLSTTSYGGLSSGVIRYWRVRVKDTNGLISPWSDAASMMYLPKGALTIANPPDGGFVEETTPPITTTLTGAAQDAVAYTLGEQQADGTWLQVWSSGRFTASAADGVAYSYTIPAGKIRKNGANYRVTVWSYDTTDRQATPGDPIYTTVQSTFTFQRSSVPAPVTFLDVEGYGPGAIITFKRNTQPDYFALRVDGDLVYDRLNSTDFLQGVDNFLTGDTASFANSKGNWTGAGNSTIAQTTADAQADTGSLAITSVAAGTATAATCVAGQVDVQGLPVSAGDTVTFSVWAKAAAISRGVSLGIQFYDTSKTFISTATSARTNDSTSAWTQITWSAVAPADGYCRGVVNRAATAAGGETGYIDTASLSGSASYCIVYNGSTPNVAHTYEVEAVVTDSGKLKHSQGNPVVTVVPVVVGIWLVPDSDAPYSPANPPRMVRIDGQESQDFTIGEASNTYYAIGRRDPITITDAIRGLEGTVTGSVRSDGNGYVDTLRWMKAPEQMGMVHRLVYATTNMPVQLGETHLTPIPLGGGNQEFSVSVAVVQVGDF